MDNSQPTVAVLMDEAVACGVSPDEPHEKGHREDLAPPTWRFCASNAALVQIMLSSLAEPLSQCQPWGWLVQGLADTQLWRENPAQFLHSMTTSSPRKCCLVSLGVMAKIQLAFTWWLMAIEPLNLKIAGSDRGKSACYRSGKSICSLV